MLFLAQTDNNTATHYSNNNESVTGDAFYPMQNINRQWADDIRGCDIREHFKTRTTVLQRNKQTQT